MTMILYQLTQWMEERSSLQQALRSGADDALSLQARIDAVEDQLYSQAERWKHSFQPHPEAIASFEVPYELPYLDGHVGM
jgi:hypothetical protein